MEWKLVNTITENDEIKRGLFPSSGGNASTSLGGGKGKVDHYYRICVILFGEHESYQDIFNSATTPASKAVWTTKIKNKIKA